jgi:hypothetical protein
MIDISAVQALHTEDDIRSLAALALERRFIAAHALPYLVPLLRSLIPASCSTLVGAPIGFPSGGHTTMIKLAEARALVQAGADELDMMINLGRLKSGDLGYVRDEIKPVVEMIAPIPAKGDSRSLAFSRMMRFAGGANPSSEEEPRSSRPGPAGRASRPRSHTFGLLTLLSKANAGSRRQEGSEIWRPSRP